MSVLAVLVLALAPVLKALAADEAHWTWGVKVASVAINTEEPIDTNFGTARLEVDEAPAVLRLPIASLPWGLFALLWVQLAITSAVLLGFLYHLKQLLRRLSDGAPFDLVNAVRLRWLGLLLCAYAAIDGLSATVVAFGVRRMLTDQALTVPVGLHVNGSLVFVGLILLTLAEVFRRGAALEHEQSLVV